MRATRSSSAAAAAAALLVWLLPVASSISVPTGKLTPITPARPTPRAINPHAPANPAPVVEYSQDHPEPPPLDPSYVPVTYNYFDTLAKHHVYYMPVRYRNFNAISNSVEYEPPQKYFGQLLGKNIGYKPYKHQLPLPYYPVRTVDWNSQYNNDVNSVYNNQYNNQDNIQYNNDYNNQGNEPYNNEHSTQNSPQYNVQPTQLHQQYQAVSTQASSPREPEPTTGKGSYDLTGKAGSKSEYYSKEDWSKKSVYPKKVLTPRKYPSHKY